MIDTNHERLDEDIAAYVLGALDPEDEAELLRHVECCERCREQIRWLAPAVQALPDSVERKKPPRELRSRILGEVQSDAARRDRGSGWWRRLGTPPTGLRARPAFGLAATLLVVAAVAGYAIGIGGSGGGALATKTVTAGQAPGVTAKVIRAEDRATLLLAGVEKLPDDRVLEAWVRRDGEVQPVRKLFVPDREGRASTTIADMSDVDLVMVTTEPAGGSDSPTSAPIVEVPIPLD